MATIIESRYSEEMSVSAVINLAFATIRNNPVATLGLALLVGAIPGLLVTYLSTFTMTATSETGPVFWAVTVFSLVGGMIISSMTQAFLTHATVAQSQGKRVSLAECARTGLVMFLPLIGLAILTSVGIGLGLLLLFVPGLMLMTAWAVAAPAMVEERLGIVGAINRSNDLTRGSRVRIFVLLVGFGILTSLATGAAEYFAGVGESDDAVAAFGNSTYLLATALAGTFASLLSGTVQSAIYVELRNVKDGPASSHLEQVFA